MIRVGLIGFGYWGRNLARNFHASNFPASTGAELAAICDSDPARLAEAAAIYPAANAVAETQSLFDDPTLDAIAIATPVSTHFCLALAAMQAGKHVWVEKPMACRSGDAAVLVEEAQRRRLVLMVDHTFVYSSAVEQIRKLVRGGELGTLYYYDSVRANLGRFQEDVDVLWDLGSHDLAILDYILDEEPCRISVEGAGHVGRQHEVAYLSLNYPSGFHAHVHVSWLAPVKIRRTMLAGSKSMLMWNDLDSIHKLEVYDHETHEKDKTSEGQRRIGYRAGAIRVPWLEVAEPLQTAVRHFLDCIATGASPLTGGESGLRVIRLLERAEGAMKT